MKVILMSAIAIAVIAVAANFGLERAGYSAQEQNAGSSVRLD